MRLTIRKKTPLMTAVEWLRFNAVEVLLKGGADSNVKNIDGETALDIAKSYRDRWPELANHYEILFGSGPETIIELLESQENRTLMENIKSGCEKCLII